MIEAMNRTMFFLERITKKREGTSAKMAYSLKVKIQTKVYSHMDRCLVIGLVTDVMKMIPDKMISHISNQ